MLIGSICKNIPGRLLVDSLLFTCNAFGTNDFKNNFTIQVKCYLSCRDQSIDLHCKSIDWFLCDEERW